MRPPSLGISLPHRLGGDYRGCAALTTDQSAASRALRQIATIMPMTGLSKNRAEASVVFPAGHWRSQGKFTTEAVRQ